VTFDLKITLNQDYIDEYYGNLTQEFGEMLREEVKKVMRNVIRETLKEDDQRLATEVRRVVRELNVQMNDVEIADLAYALVDSMKRK
jgi:F0F1-type ATP synthase membrane subunit b/b'